MPEFWFSELQQKENVWKVSNNINSMLENKTTERNAPWVVFLMLYLILVYRWLTMLCWFQLYSKVIQFYINMYLFFFFLILLPPWILNHTSFPNRLGTGLLKETEKEKGRKWSRRNKWEYSCQQFHFLIYWLYI